MGYTVAIMKRPPGALRPMYEASAFPFADPLDADQPTGNILVRQLIPGAYEAHVRILHPPSLLSGRLTSWAAVAQMMRGNLGRAKPFRAVTVPEGEEIPPGPTGAWPIDGAPTSGALPREQASQLVRILGPAEPCAFALWDGWEGLRLHAEQASIRVLGNPHLLFAGPLEVVTHFDWTSTWQPPNLWLPDSGAWCVATYVDAFDTYVGCPGETANLILESRVEAMRVEPTDVAVHQREWLLGRVHDSPT
jgi:hypothetical protein